MLEHNLSMANSRLILYYQENSHLYPQRKIKNYAEFDTFLKEILPNMSTNDQSGKSELI